ncbi:hypothetical protein [Clostridium beijerinckii]|uniref:hypothetical protein n=1 Tax=Clostridium beijerinckii TaxID=1520 RepID=UPI0012D2A1FE|nr:hypothetical protein [Clostridium beijerinckii]
MVISNTNIGNIIKYCSIIRIDYLLEKDSLSLLCFFEENSEGTILRRTIMSIMGS